MAPELNVGNLVGYFTLDTSDLDRARTDVTSGLGDIRTTGARAAGAAGAAIGAALTGSVMDAARDMGRAGQRAGENLGNGVAQGARGAVSAVDKLRAQSVLAADKAAAAMARYEQAVADAARGNTTAQGAVRRLGAEATIAGADAQRAMEQFETAAQQAGRTAADAGKDAEKMFGGVGDAAKGALAGLGLGTVLAKAMNADDATRKLSAQLHLSAEEAGRFGKDAGALYSGNFAGSLEEANDAIKSVVLNIDGMRTASDADLQSITGQVTSLASTFDQDLGGVTIAVGQMMKTGMARNAQEALDLITAGFQAGNDKAGDFLDTLNEYPVQFQKAGLDGKAALGLITQGLQGGARDSDLVADSIKEIGINLLDTGSNAATGLQMLGLNAQEVMGKYKLGGKNATEALQSIFDRVHELGGATQNMGALANIASSQIEDMGSSFDKLDTRTVADSLGDVAGRAQDLTNTVGGSASGAITSFWNSLQTTATTIGQELLPSLTPLLPALQTLGGVAGDLVGAFTGLPAPLKNAGLALGAILLLKGPLIGMFGQVQARAAAMAVSLAASNGIAGAAGAAAGGVSRLAGFLGGPWGVAIGLGVTALATFASGNHDSEEAVAANKARIDALAGTLDTVTGKLTLASTVKIGQDWIAAGTADKFKDVQTGAAGATDALLRGGPAIDAYREKIFAAAGSMDTWADKMDSNVLDGYAEQAARAGVSVVGLYNAVKAGGPGFDDLAKRIQAASIASGEGSTNLDEIKSSLVDTAGEFDNLNPALAAFNDQVTSTGQATQIAADSIKLQKDATKAAADAEAARGAGMVTTMGTMDAFTAAEDERTAAAKRAGEATKSLSQYVTEQQSGYTAAYRNTMDLQGAQQQLAAAVKAVKDAPTKDFAAMEKSIKGVADQTSKASTETSAFAIEIDKLTGRNVPLQDATKALNDQVRNLAGTFGDAQGIIDAHARSLVNDAGVIDTTTEAGSKLYDSVTDYSDAYNTSVTAAVDAAGAHATVAQKVAAAGTAADAARKQFITQATQLGLTDTQANTLATSMGILEGKKLTPKTLHLDAEDKASGDVDALNTKVQGLQDKTVQLRVHAVGMIDDAAGNASITLNSDGSFRTGNNQTGMATGGYVSGPGTGTSDSINARLSNGEFVNTALSTARNRKALEFANRGGIIPGFATGGYVNVSMTEQDDGTDAAIGKIGAIMGNAASSAAKNNDAVAAAAKAAASAVPRANSGGTEQWRALFNHVAAIKGEDPASVQVGLNQMSRESSGNPAAINLTDSNAQAGHPSKGLLQFIQGTFDSFADPGYNSNIWDPESQMRAWYNYINSNYGGWQKFGQRGYGAYAEGGPVSGPGTGSSDSINARLSNGEFVNSALSTSRNRKALEYANAGGIIPGFAAGGYVGTGNVTARALSGAADPAFTERLGRTMDALAGLVAEVASAREVIAQAGQDEHAAYDSLTQARAAQRTATGHELVVAKAKTKAAEREYQAAVKQREAATMNAAAASSTMRMLAQTVRQQQTAARQYDRISAKLDNATDKLSNLKGDRQQLQDDVAGNAAGFGGGITGSSDTRRTGAAVLAGLRYDLGVVARFKNDLAAAKAKGLDPALLAQVGKGGPDQNGVTAHALATASRADVAAINDTQRRILAVSNQAGNIVAGAQFDPLIKSQQKVVDSLAHTLSGLDKYLAANGRVMADAVNRAMAQFKVEISPQGIARIVNEGNRQLARRG